MTNVIISLVLWLGALGASAATTDAACAARSEAPRINASSLRIDSEALGDEGVKFFSEALKSSPLYGLSLSLESSRPDITKTIEYIGLFKEAHHLNEQLADLMIEVKKGNQLLASIVSQNPTQQKKE